jgi:hypothetical protein
MLNMYLIAPLEDSNIQISLPTLTPLDQFCAVDLKTLIEQLHQDNTVIITFATKETLELTLNLVASLKLLQISNYLIISLDSTASKLLQDEKLPCFQSFGKIESSDLDYIRMVHAVQILEMGYNIFVVNEDSVFIESPFNIGFSFDISDCIMEEFDSQGTEGKSNV